jgi:Domain of unknown function (DUF3786)
LKALEHISFPEIAERVCALYSEEQDALLLGMLGQEYLVTREGVFLRGQRAPETHATIVLNYLFAPDKESVLKPWRAIGDFAGGITPDFRKKVELPLTHYASEIIARANALLPMIDAKTEPSIIGSDLAIAVRALPKVHLHVELSQETQDFPAEAWILYSSNADKFLDVPNLLMLTEIFKDRLLSLIRIY